MHNIGIYLITSPSGKKYVGQSLNIKRRFLNYQRMECKQQPRLYYSFKKHNVLKHVFEILEICPINKLNTRERYWQEYFKVIGENGLNCSLVSTTEKKFIYSDDTRKKISNKLNERGHPLSKITLDLQTGIYYDNLKMACNAKGLIYDTIKMQLRGTNKNKTDLIYCDKPSTHKTNQAKGIEPSNYRNVKIILDTQTGVFYETLKEVAELINIERRKLSYRINNKTKTNLIFV
jgi:group I intron endonuclease